MCISRVLSLFRWPVDCPNVDPNELMTQLQYSSCPSEIEFSQQVTIIP